jgi:hypothetical protein
MGISKQQRKAGTKYSFHLKWLEELPSFLLIHFSLSLDECLHLWAAKQVLVAKKGGGQMIGVH